VHSESVGAQQHAQMEATGAVREPWEEEGPRRPR